MPLAVQHANANGSSSGPNVRFVGQTVADVERHLILDTLDYFRGNRTHAARILGISIRTLRNKLNEYADGGIPITPAGAGDYHRAAVG